MSDISVPYCMPANKRLQRILARLEHVGANGTGYSARCPAHDDHKNSLTIALGERENIVMHCHAGCLVEEIVEAIGLRMRHLFPRTRSRRRKRPAAHTATPAPVSQPPAKAADAADAQATTATPAEPPAASDATEMRLTVADYAANKRLPITLLEEVGLSDMYYEGRPAVSIPHYDEDGKLRSTLFRLAKTGRNILRWKRGDQQYLYGVWRLKAMRAKGYIVVVEGQSDCHTLWLFREPALGLPSASAWRGEWEDLLEGFATIYVVIEPDQGGETLLKHLTRSRLRDRIRLIVMDGAKDPSALYLQDPERFPEAWQQARDGALPWTAWERRDKETQQDALWHQCEALAREPRILRRFGADVGHFVAGETRIPTLLYLALTTRFLRDPVSIVVKGPSGAGKSYVPVQVLRFFPTEAYHVLMSASERVLLYDDEPVAHRFIVLYEADGLKNEFFQYLLRSLLTEGHIRYATVEKTRDGLRTRWIEREGPTGLLTSTTAVSLEPQLETRVWSVTAPDTPAQTKTILAFLGAQAEAGLDDDAADDAVDLTVWRAFQQWLAGAEHRVVIPYATILAKDIPSLAVRLPRDFKRLLSLIRAHALLHQVNRRRDPQGRIIAMVHDYAVVRQLVRDWMAEGLEASVPKAIRDTVETVEQHCETHPSASVTALAKHLELDVSTVSRRVQVALQRGYLQNLETVPGRTYQLILGQPLPSERPILPKPKRVWLLSRAAERRQRAASCPSHA
jgi:hypothetical protein